MSVYLFQVALEHVSGMPEDVVVNTFHAEATLGVGVPQFALDVFNFYDQVQTNGFRVWDFISQELTGDCTIKVYEDETAPPHIPVYTLTDTMAAGSALPSLPDECAAVLSFKAASVPGIDIRSTRGRVYIGPLNVAACAGFVAGPPYNWSEPVRVRTELRDTLCLAGGILMANNSADQTWVVWSRVQATGYEIVEGFCDNEFDTQRRRSPAATARSTF